MAHSRDRVTIPLAKIVGPSLANPFDQDSSSPKYGCALLIDKNDAETIARVRALIDRAISNATATKWGGQAPKTLRSPLRDGDVERDSDDFSGYYFVNASTRREPSLFHADGSKADGNDFETGSLVKAEINCYAYDFKGRRGVAIGLDGLWLLQAAEPDDDPRVRKLLDFLG